jgi:hypothetical protein
VIIDSHTHIFPPEVIANRERYLQADGGFAELYSDPSSRIATAENLIDSMDNSGVDMSIVCGFNWERQELCAVSNDYILDAIGRYPSRLIGLATLRPEAGDAALYDFERCVSGGVRGIGEMRLPAACLDISLDNLWTPVARLLSDRDLLCLFHSSEPVGHPYPGKSDMTPPVLYPFIKRFPEVRFILAHWGGGMPFYALMPEVKKALSNTWFDTAASSYLYDPMIYKQVIQITGSGRILFGSDYPLLQQKRCLKDIRGIGLPGEDSINILGLNAMKLLGIKDDTK